MNIFHKVTLQSLKKNRARTAVTVIGVVLSAAMITAVATFGVSLLDYMAEGAARKYGDWHAAFVEADPTFAREQAESGQVARTVTFENVGYAALDGGRDPHKPYLFIAGFDEDAFANLPIGLYSGRLPENSGELLVSGSVASKGGVRLAVGDTVSLAVGDRLRGNERLGQNTPYIPGGETLGVREERTYKIVGICQTPSFEEDLSPGYTVITRSENPDRASSLSLFVTLKNPRQAYSYADGIQGRGDCMFNHRVLRFVGLSRDPGDRLITALLFAAGAIAVAIIMVGSVFLIYNSFQISLNERIRQFGILASVGATSKQLRNSVLFEGLCIGAAGIPAGVVLGLASMGVVISVVAGRFGDILYEGVPLTLQVSAPAIAGAAAVSLITILISAYIPARKAAGTPVMECIRQTGEIKVEAGNMRTSGLARRIYGLEGTLALKNFRRNRRRCRSIVLSLVLSILLFVSSSAFVENLQQMAEQAKSVTDYDIGFGTQDMDDGELWQLYGRLKTAAGVCGSSLQFVEEYVCAVRPEALSDAYRASAGGDLPEEAVELPMEVQFLDDETYLKIVGGLGLPVDEYTGQGAKLIAVAKMEDSSGQAENVSQLQDLFAGSNVEAALIPRTGGEAGAAEGRSFLLTCVELVPPDIPPAAGGYEQRPYDLQVLAPCSLMGAVDPSGAADLRVKGLTFRSEDPSRTAEEMNGIIQGAAVTAGYLFMNTAEMFAESRNYVFIANVFAYTFIVVISLIAAANVFNTISTNIRLRRRELAMLRSVGMADKDFNKMMCFECAFYGIWALAIGLPMAAASCWLIYRGMFIGGAEGLDFALPWSSIGISVFSVLLVIFSSMMYAVRRIKKENIIDALRDEMT